MSVEAQKWEVVGSWSPRPRRGPEIRMDKESSTPGPGIQSEADLETRSLSVRSLSHHCVIFGS